MTTNKGKIIDPTDPGIVPPRKGALSDNPQTFNFLSPLNFKFLMNRTPNLNFEVVRINIPSIGLPAPIFNNPLVDLPQPGDQPSFSPLVVQFKVDENFNNYVEVYKWMMQLSGLPNQMKFNQLSKNPYWTGLGEKSEILITILDSAKNVNIIIDLHDAFPTSLSELIFDAQLGDIPYITATVVFAYSFFEIEQVLKSE